MVFIYILQLENNKYYVGKSNNPDFRLNNDGASAALIEFGKGLFK